MGLLDGDLARSIFAGFTGKLLTGALRKVAVAESGALDQRGDPLDSAPALHACEGFTDLYSETFRAAAGIPKGDLKVCIFAESLPAGVIPEIDDKARMDHGGRLGAKWYQIRARDIDPAGALWECQSFEIEEPA